MPIVRNNKDSIEVLFGKGDILIGSGMMGCHKNGLVTLIEQDPHPIGEYKKHDNVHVDLNEIPLYFVFENIESLNVLMERLERVHMYMSGELDIKDEIDK